MRPTAASNQRAASTETERQQRAASTERERQQQRPVSSGRPRPSLTIPQSPMLRTKLRHHSVRGRGWGFCVVLNRRGRPSWLQLWLGASSCCYPIAPLSLCRCFSRPSHLCHTITLSNPQPPRQPEPPKSEFRARPAPAFDAVGAK